MQTILEYCTCFFQTILLLPKNGGLTLVFSFWVISAVQRGAQAVYEDARYLFILLSSLDHTCSTVYRQNHVKVSRVVSGITLNYASTHIQNHIWWLLFHLVLYAIGYGCTTRGILNDRFPWNGHWLLSIIKCGHCELFTITIVNITTAVSLFYREPCCKSTSTVFSCLYICCSSGWSSDDDKPMWVWILVSISNMRVSCSVCYTMVIQ